MSITPHADASAIDRESARAINDFAARCKVSLKANSSHDFFYFLSFWEALGSAKERALVGRKILDLLREIPEAKENPEIVREVLAYVGTPNCTCPRKDAWKAVNGYLTDDNVLLSVKMAAVAAAKRLAQTPPPSGEEKEQATGIAKCLGILRALSVDLNPLLKDQASLLMRLIQSS